MSTEVHSQSLLPPGERIIHIGLNILFSSDSSIFYSVSSSDWFQIEWGNCRLLFIDQIEDTAFTVPEAGVLY